MKKIISIVFIAVLVIWAQEKQGLKLPFTGACVSSCVNIHYIVEPSAIFETGYVLTGAEYACAVNQVGRKCLEDMKEQRRKNKSFKMTRQGAKMVEEYTTADYIYCRLGRFRAKVETCVYSHPPIRHK